LLENINYENLNLIYISYIKRESKKATIKYTGCNNPHAIHEISLYDLTVQTGMQSAHAKSEVPCFFKDTNFSPF